MTAVLKVDPFGIGNTRCSIVISDDWGENVFIRVTINQNRTSTIDLESQRQLKLLRDAIDEYINARKEV